jgi:capsular polysaccharide biosynthesis protein
LALAVAVFGAGATLSLTRPVQWSATAPMLVAPRASSASADTLASLYDTLSRGQVAATYAELLGNEGVTTAAITKSGISRAEQRGLSVKVTVIADTSVIDAIATARTATLATRMADAMAQEATDRVDVLAAPYVVSPTASAAGSATRAGLGTTELLVLTGAIALFAGILAQQGWSATRRGRRLARAIADDSAPSAPGSNEWPAVIPRGSPREVSRETTSSR